MARAGVRVGLVRLREVGDEVVRKPQHIDERNAEAGEIAQGTRIREVDRGRTAAVGVLRKGIRQT